MQPAQSSALRLKNSKQCVAVRVQFLFSNRINFQFDITNCDLQLKDLTQMKRKSQFSLAQRTLSFGLLAPTPERGPAWSPAVQG